MSVAESETLGQKFRRMRTDLGLTQREAAEVCGISLETISLWENGHRQFNHKDQTVLIRQSLQILKRRIRWRDQKR